MIDTVVIGAGLFGSMIAAELRRIGQQVITIDRGELFAGSGPAACLIKPSWLGGMGEHRDSALEKLNELYTVHELMFSVGALGLEKKEPVFWVNPTDIMLGKDMYCDVTRIEPAGRTKTVWCKEQITGEEFEIESLNLVIAAGVWTEQLYPEFKQKAQWGAASLWRNEWPSQQPKIRPWAPYKQLVAFDRGDGTWVGDGSALLYKNLTSERLADTLRREAEFVGLPMETATVLQGFRPYAKGHKPCLLESPDPNVWVASGGAKNGTIAAAHCARVIGEELS